MAGGAIYRAELAKRLRTLGFQVEQDDKSEGCFRIAGMPKDLESHFSKRTNAIEAETAKRGFSSQAAKKIVSLELRKHKEEVHRHELLQRWQEESQAKGFDAQRIEQLKHVDIELFKLPEISEILETLTEHDSTFEARDLDRLLAEYGQYTDFDRPAKAAEILQSADCVPLTLARIDNGTGHVHAFTVYTSKALQELEKRCIEQAQARQEETAHHLSANTVTDTIARIEAENNYTLRDEQRQAVQHLTQQSGGIALMRGLAGTGKTTTLRTIVEAFKSEGFKVHGATISAQAAGILSAETGLRGSTIAQTLIDLDRQKIKLTSKSVLILDEAGMVGSRDFARLQAHCDAAGAKLIAVGDERQLQAIHAGGIFEALQRHGQIQTADLTTITRQGDARDREASRLLYEGKAQQALDIYAQRGQICTAYQREDLLAKMSRDYVNDTSSTAQKLMLASTRAEALALNHAAREELKCKNMLDDSQAVTLENADGDTLEMCPGDRVIFKRNSRVRGIVNNLKGTVTQVQRQGDKTFLYIQCDDGKTRTIDSSEYKDIRHGYAITGHASQGATVEKSFVLFNRGTADLSWGYVAMTRHKDRVKLYATEADKPALAERFAKANFKGTTLDLTQQEKSTPSQEENKIASAHAHSRAADGQLQSMQMSLGDTTSTKRDAQSLSSATAEFDPVKSLQKALAQMQAKYAEADRAAMQSALQTAKVNKKREAELGV